MEELQQIWQIFDLVTQGSSDTAGAYLSQVLDRSVEWFDAAGGSIFLLQPNSGDYLPSAKAGDLAQIPWDAVIRSGEGIAGKAIAEQTPILMGNPLAEQIQKETPKTRADISSSLIVPLIARSNGTVGVLCLSRRLDQPTFTQRDLDKASSLGSYIALAVSNARLLQQHQEVERLKRLAEIGQMTASIAHEIRNPLTGIRSAAQMITQNPELADEFSKIIEVEATKLNALCDEFLNFAKPLTLSLRGTLLSDLVLNVCQLHQPDFEAKRITLVTSVAQDEPFVDLDGPRIEQVVRNLLLNALQASSSGGRVTVTVSRNGSISVEDRGAGMDSDTVTKLFSPFFTTKSSGTGLGLCLARKIMDAHGGQIRVTSELGRGSRFDIVFPLEQAA
ncbi:MAG: GAF domain-containing protein [Armatimonadetes bacterium]|nr:GAF domain-containing protein [Armatimonadota bacterium]